MKTNLDCWIEKHESEIAEINAEIEKLEAGDTTGIVFVGDTLDDVINPVIQNEIKWRKSHRDELVELVKALKLFRQMT